MPNKTRSTLEDINTLDALIAKARKDNRHGSMKYFIRKKALIEQGVNQYKVAKFTAAVVRKYSPTTQFC